MSASESAQLDQALSEYSEAVDNGIVAVRELVNELGYERGIVAAYNSLRDELNPIHVAMTASIAFARLAGVDTRGDARPDP